jgi:hypothetical protein
MTNATVEGGRARQAHDHPPMTAPCECEDSTPAEWLSALRLDLVHAGYDPARVDAVLDATVARYRSGRVRDYVPLLVERAAYRELRGH